MIILAISTRLLEQALMAQKWAAATGANHVKVNANLGLPGLENMKQPLTIVVVDQPNRFVVEFNRN